MVLALVVALIAGAAGLAAKHDGVLSKGYDPTYRDTIAFEKQAALNALERIEKLEQRNAEKAREKSEENNAPVKPQMREPNVS